MKNLVAVTVLASVCALSCNYRKDKSTTTTGLTATYSSINSNIFIPKCVSCHTSPNTYCGATACGSLDTSVYSQVAARTSAGSPSSSNLYLRVTTQAPVMPLNASGLSAEEQQAIFNWILNGARNN